MANNPRFFVNPNGSYIGSYDGPDETMPAMFKGCIQVATAPMDARQIWDGAHWSVISQPYQIAKTTPWLRMTQEEARIMDGVMTETDAQMRQVYNAAQYLSSDDQFWGTLHQLIADNLGAERADELLAPEG